VAEDTRAGGTAGTAESTSASRDGLLADGRREGLLVDWGGVLTTNLFVSFNEYCVREGIDFEALGQRFLGDSEFRALLIALETGKLTEREFEPRLAELLGVAPEGLIDGLLAGVRPDEAMIEAVRSARGAGVRTALVSNSWGVHRYPRALFEEIFDGLVISGEVGVRKPAPRMYELGAQRAGVPPERCVYVDDLAHNLEPARDLGMATVHHTTSETTIPQLERLLDMELAGGDGALRRGAASGGARDRRAA
jgi:putative hydrolase of the HAD superfamily